MTFPLVLFLFSVVTPLFFARTRSAPVWLGAQALALAWATQEAHQGADSTHLLLVMFELIIVRAGVVPLLLAHLVRQRAEARIDLMPSNLFSWALGMALVVLSFEFGEATPGTQGTFAIGIVSATVVSGLLMLAMNDSSVVQLVAILFIENGIAMFEWTFAELWPLPVHAALVGVYVVTACLGVWLLAPEGIGTASGEGTREVL